MTSKFHHVVGATTLRRIGAEFGGQFPGIGVPRFAIARAARAVRALTDNFVPEVFGNVAIPLFARQFVITRSGDDLWDVRVDVQTLQFIAMGGKRIEENFLIEPLRYFQ